MIARGFGIVGATPTGLPIGGDKSCFIERVRGQGYRFIAPVERLGHAGIALLQDDRSGAMLLHYRLVAKAGAGSMGEVWKAKDTKLGRTVALKFVPQRLAADAAAIAAFRQEAQHAASLNHPNICTIHGLEEHDGQHFLAMEYIDDAIAGPVPPDAYGPDDVMPVGEFGIALLPAHPHQSTTEAPE